MIQPDFSGFLRASRKDHWVAVTGTLLADLETPVSSFLKVAATRPNAFLLESAEQSESIGRYSIIGVDPPEVWIQEAGGTILCRRANRTKKIAENGDLTAIIRGRMKEFKVANPSALEGFAGGYVGFLSYENVETFEDIHLRPLPGPKTPRGVFFLCHEFLVFDHFRKQLRIVTMVPAAKGRAAAARQYQKARRRIQALAARLSKQLRVSTLRHKSGRVRLVSNMTRTGYQARVRKIKEYIRAGDIIQAVLSQRFTMTGHRDDFQIYRSLRSINPSPYMFYFRCGDLRLVGTSPELLVKKQGTLAEVRPIAGTRPRGRTPEEDLKLEENLKRSAKEMAEHVMLVDLGRNDLGRVCRFNSIRVRNFGRIERYSHVMHLVSDVEGRLKPGKNSFDLLKATFPAGTVSGAPKIRAMQIINELEPEKRGPYAGSVGYFGFNGDMDMCIAIRTLVAHAGKLYLQAGAGIVKDSNPGREYQETVNKAQALLKAVCEPGEAHAPRH